MYPDSISALKDEDIYKGTYYDLVDFDKDFSELETPPVILTDIDISTQEKLDELNAMLVREIDSETLSAKPTCSCNNPLMTGGEFLGRICPKCRTEVTHPVEREFKSNFWLRAPEGVPGFISPVFHSQLNKVLGTKLLDWLLDPKYKPDSKKFDKLVHKYSMKRGYNHFIENFDSIIQTLLEAKMTTLKRQVDIDRFLQYLQENRTKFFPKYLALPASFIFIKESSFTGSYIDANLPIIIGAIHSLLWLETDMGVRTSEVIQRRVANVHKHIASYYWETHAKTMSGKSGMFRKHYDSGRPPNTFRAVITSEHGMHDTRGIRIPYTIAMSCFQGQILGELMREGMSLNKALLHYNRYLNKFDEKLYSIMTNIIHSHVHDEPRRDEWCTEPLVEPSGTPCGMSRNPILARLGCEDVIIVGIKTDVHDMTISISVNCLKGPNADEEMTVLIY